MGYVFYNRDDVTNYCEELLGHWHFKGKTDEKQKEAHDAAVVRMAELIINHQGFAYDADAVKVLDDILGAGETDLAAIVDKYGLDIYYGFFQ
ncbi:MAG: hypothetical protein LBU64_05910 [Planctomycetota bacterium]|jgi:hypothetical protein|nr:hypothetical protein [Planctomycetota bacterium]